MSQKCPKCPEWERRKPAGTHTQTFNGITHTHPECARIALERGQ